MIKNKKQAALTLERIEGLKKDNEEVKNDNSISDIEKEYALNSFEAMIDMLQEEYEEYQYLTRGNLHFLKAESLEELPDMLIKARIALGMSQTELATRLSMAPQQIQRYEANNYQTISFSRLVDIAVELEMKVSFKDIIIIGNGPKFEVPNNLNEAQVDETENLVLGHCSIVM